MAQYNTREGVEDMKRVDIKAILADPILRRMLMVRVIMATQAREGIETTAENAYDNVRRNK